MFNHVRVVTWASLYFFFKQIHFHKVILEEHIGIPTDNNKIFW